MQDKKIHQGRNIKRFREMLGIKQEALAFDLNCSQQKISIIEQKETVEKDMLEKIAGLLNVPVEAIENMEEDQAVNIIANTFDNGSILNGINYNPSFHPIDKVLQLHEEKIALYERMLKEKDEMMAKLEQYLQKP
ncbi:MULTISPECIES: helix-turn-helix domain-containing protein [Chryseobacterium]|uniref:Transcriptional regulator with XRE-family HTH domain n=1 Tax=Chryseobacterium camelliae TaxID=1265445 RepID=A0ABU0TKJ0_9FLAO|nr:MULTISPECIES: helix-turn-helix transcriptional regulator [Chryseobacterium]MDT3408572.1 transcriptional regulator with XRE-family HTH domain [Pseudacidovorax intermedius]MDQ1097573.1 transcriptional regulator with XRE-family HTH domain [Chryseobacterium camelliae]MDQ1101502.1 transcriptional regulator with XRE-family HTH domain [Chryseobacterium sp. SORGH_AS_1048]MDR6084945.1 transcriptional regulator with XRE-family HTH domain [Chryseobacterium sp. SORGH_AS_0909]MDR6129298.1 transcriptiona